MDNDGSRTHTVLELARQQGWRTGIVATSQINHATPAAFMSHVPQRKMYNAIADSYFDERVNGHFKADLMLGGGQQYFQRQDRDLVTEFKQAGWHYISQLSQLEQHNKLPLLGLFAPVGLPYAIDSEQPRRLLPMATAALRLLGRDKAPFFVMIEGSQIDWCGHANDIACAMAEMDDFAATLKMVKAYVDAHPDALLVATADHSTGGLSLGADKVYHWRTDVVRGIRASLETIVDDLMKQDELTVARLRHWLGFAPDDKAMKKLHKARAKGPRALHKRLVKVITKASYTGWTTRGHTATDVQVFAYGRGAAAFAGHLDNTDIPRVLRGYIQAYRK